MYRTAITSGAATLLLVVSARGSGADSEDTPSVTETSRVSTTEGGESETSST